MVKLILLIVICTLAGFIFFLTRRIARLKNTGTPVEPTDFLGEPKETDPLKKEFERLYQKSHNLSDSLQVSLWQMERARLDNLNEMQIERDKKAYEYEMKKYEFTQSIELYNLLCSLIESSPYLARNLQNHAREESVIILKNAANLTPEQYNKHRTMLFQVVETVQNQQLQPISPVLAQQQFQPVTPVSYKEAN